jgi:hypothetical protein
VADQSSFWREVEDLSAAIARVSAVNVNSDATREEARNLAQRWFREVRPQCASMGMGEEDLRGSDELLQYLLRLANGRNAKRSYSTTLRALRKLRPVLETRLETSRGLAATRRNSGVLTALEAGIVRTLEQMLPHAALSYRQVLEDLAAPERYSYRGTATELREVVRETLDHLAPDADVMRAAGFKLEKDRKAPTMKQKARFILKARGLGDSSRSAPESSVELLEDQTASLARSVYERGSASTHAATAKSQVLSFKAYADAVLAELLQLHLQAR